MRLFSAIVPPDGVLDELEAELGRIGARAADAAALRWLPRTAWHVTLCFYGEDDLDERSAWLDLQLRGHAARPLAISGAGTFPGVLWSGVAGELDDLASASGADAEGRPHHAHLTLARWRHPTGQRPGKPWAKALANFRGRSWQAGEVVLMSSKLSRTGASYTVQHRYELVS